MITDREYEMYVIARLRMQGVLQDLQTAHEAREAERPQRERRRFLLMYRIRKFLFRLAPKMARAWFF